MHITAEMQSAWTELWSTGHFDSLPQDRAAGLLGPLDAVWKGFFSSFQDGAKLLDLATGGGEVIRAAFALGQTFRVTGVDIADLSAVGVAFEPQNVTLIGNTDLSRLPFADASFDGVTSQFGIEYADIPAATREAVRVLVPGGRGQFVLHHAQSAITQGVVNTMAAERSVLGDSDAFALGGKLFALSQSSAPPEATAEAQTVFLAAVKGLQSRLKEERAFGTSRNVVGFLMRLATAPGSIPAAEAFHRLGAVERDINARTLRKQAQLDAALDRDGIGKIAERLSAAGAFVNPPRELHYPGGKLMAWSLSFSKPPSTD